MKKYKINTSFIHKGEKFTVHADTQTELFAKAAARMAEIDERKRIDMTVEGWTKKAIDAYKIRQSEKTRADFESIMRRHIYPSIGHLSLKDVTRTDCQMILNSVSDKSSSLIRKVHQALCFVFETAEAEDLIIKAPTRKLVVPQGRKAEARSITHKERYHLLKCYLKDPRFSLFLLMLYCGCRPAEAARVKGCDIYMTDKGPMLAIHGTKTENAERIVPIPSVLYKRIKGTPADAYVATTEKGTPFNKQGYHRLVKHLKREMNLSMGCKTYRNKLITPYPLQDDFRPYLLRHTYGSDLIGRLDLKTLSYLMGHADISTTANVYLHVGDDHLAKAADVINKIGE